MAPIWRHRFATALPRECLANAGTPPDRASRRFCVVLALPEGTYPTASLLRAQELSRGLGAGLHVVRVVPQLSAANALFLRRSLSPARQSHAARTVERTLSAHRATRAWLADSLADARELEQVALLQGNFDSEVATYARGVRARLVIVASRARRMGRTVVSLVESCKVPVLVARELRTRDAIVAATDLQSPDYPVLRAAAELVACLDARLVAVHNVNPISILVGSGVGWPAVTVLPADRTRAARAVRLAKATERLAVAATAVVRDELSAAEAILDEAELHDADLVVVGTRHRGWLDQLLGASVAAQVVNRARRSVLVTPIDEPPASAI
ncbi:MAG: universal stress protein [Deltaproteobacteria bacterium]